MRAPVLLAAAAGLALSASGCIIDSSNDGCAPDLTVYWLITSALDDTALTCYEAGNANAVVAKIDGGGIGPVFDEYFGPCPANWDEGSFVAQLPSTGLYNISLELRSGASVLSATQILTKSVDCSGLSATPPAELFVNF